MALRSLASGVARRRASLQRLAAPQLLAARFYASEGEQKVKDVSGVSAVTRLQTCCLSAA
jgi:hypothetical protein